VLSALAPLGHSTSSAVLIKQPPAHTEEQSEGSPVVQEMMTDLFVAPVIQTVSEAGMTCSEQAMEMYFAPFALAAVWKQAISAAEYPHVGVGPASFTSSERPVLATPSMVPTGVVQVKIFDVMSTVELDSTSTPQWSAV
jgi:hypothetical protein